MHIKITLFMKALNQLFCVSIIALCLASCGQKGPLYLPDATKQPAITKA